MASVLRVLCVANLTSISMRAANERKSVIRAVSSKGAIKTKVNKPVIRKVARSPKLKFDESTKDSSLDGISQSVHALENRVEVIEHAIQSPHLSLQQVMTCPNHAPASKTLCLERGQYDQIVGETTAIMQEFKTGSPCTNNNCMLADFAGCVLRAVGHDFMDLSVAANDAVAPPPPSHPQSWPRDIDIDNLKLYLLANIYTCI